MRVCWHSSSFQTVIAATSSSARSWNDNAITIVITISSILRDSSIGKIVKSWPSASNRYDPLLRVRFLH